MKSILLISCLFPLFLSAQECKVLSETDPYTKETRLSSGFIALQGGSSVSVEADSKEIDIFFIINDRCFDDDASNVVAYFEGTKVKTTYRNAGSMNCTGYFHIRVRNGTVTPTNIKKMATQKVTQFVFTDSNKKQVTVTLSPEQQEIFMKSAGCVTEEAKKLIK
jgi:hypothetical protein